MAFPPSRAPATADRDWWWVFDPRESLRAAAALFFGVTGVLFTALLATMAGRTVQQTIEQHVGGGFESLAAQLGDKIDRTIYERYGALQLAANLPVLRSTASAPADRRRLLEALQEATPDFAWIGFLDPAGRVMAATQGRQEGTEAEMRPWFRGARQQPYASNPREAPEIAAMVPAPKEGESSSRFFDLAVPVTDANGRFAGVLAAHLRWGWTRDVQLSVVPESARRERIGVTLYSANGDVLLDSGGSGWTRPPDAPAVPDRRFRGNVVEPTSLGTTYLTGYARSRGFREYRGLGWIAAVRQPADLAFAPVAATKRSIARWGFAFTGVGMIGGWIFAGRISRRLRSISTAAGRIQTGDVLATLPSGRGEGEVERMCGALNALVADLRAKSAEAAAPPPDR